MGAVASPSVRKLAMDRGVDIDTLAADLGRETIGREDLPGGTRPVGPAAFWDVDHARYGPVEVEPLARPARVAAANLSAAQALIPAVAHRDGADMTKIEAARAEARSRGARISALAFHVAILTRCLKEFPRFNSSLSPDGRSLILKRYFHVGIAVDAPHGLYVPVVRDADRKRVPEISEEIVDLAARVRDRRMRPEETGGASMTITSLGGIGGESFTPIVNPPEVAILGLARIEIRPVWDGESFRPRPIAPLDLCYDHRVVNGADAARFLSRYRELVTDPSGLLIVTCPLK